MSYESRNPPPDEHGPKPDRIIPRSVHVSREGTVTLHLDYDQRLRFELLSRPPGEEPQPRERLLEAKNESTDSTAAPNAAVASPEPPGQAQDLIITYSAWPPGAYVVVPLSVWPPGTKEVS